MQKGNEEMRDGHGALGKDGKDWEERVLLADCKEERSSLQHWDETVERTAIKSAKVRQAAAMGSSS